MAAAANDRETRETESAVIAPSTTESELDIDLFRQTYERIVEAYARFLPPGSVKNPNPALAPEPFEACLAVERHRRYWKPKNPKLVMLAESHVYTDADDLDCATGRDLLPQPAAEANSVFVRLIYCLAYGDNSLLARVPRQSNETETPFWQFFAWAAGLESPPTLTAKSKVEILLAMKDRGVWLADASIHACMNPRMPRDDRRRNIGNFRRLYETVVRTSWGYVRRTIADDARVWVIGKGVYDVLRDDPLLDHSRWIYQPGARLQGPMRLDQARRISAFREELLSYSATASAAIASEVTS